ncbi:VWA domain-containing protein [Orbus sturtevantii]|uniref:vWA domain-containing protein n=1 Tax=Orbus sturtevantii TaxID=3074109 RepID=UPI00370D1105
MKISNRLLTIYKKLILTFINNNAGSIIVAFAIMSSLIFICFVVSLNNAYVLKSRAQISEASNEASLAIVAVNNKNATVGDIDKNEKLALSYMNYYLTRKIEDANNGAKIGVTYNSTDKEYYVSYQRDVNALIRMNTLGKLGTSIAVGNKKESFGNTRKSNVLAPIDIGFVADFSSSATCNYNNIACNEDSIEFYGDRRLDYMRTAIGGIINLFAPYSAINFAFIPYDIGVPVKNDQKNQAGGNSYSCSVLYKLKDPYAGLDYNFWANKSILYGEWLKLKQQGVINNYLTFDYFNQYRNMIFYYLDYYRYYYYQQIVGPALNYKSDAELVSSGLCTKKHMLESVVLGESMYGCGVSESDYPLNSSNRNIVTNQYAKMVQLYDYMYSGDYDAHYSFANAQTVDIQGTLDTLFSDMQGNTITFTKPIAPAMAEFSPFMGMCLSPIYNNKIMAGYNKNNPNATLAKTAGAMVTFDDSLRLIPFDLNNNNSAQLASYINGNKWRPGGGTDTMTALLRAVPVFAKGRSPHKVVIIISDGKDDAGADTLRDNFLDQGVCQVITNGLTSPIFEQQGYIDKAADSAAIYYIKLAPKSTALANDADYEAEFGKWFTKCMNKNKQYLYIATDYQSLFDISKYIIESETGVFIKH